MACISRPRPTNRARIDSGSLATRASSTTLPAASTTQKMRVFQPNFTTGIVPHCGLLRCLAQPNRWRHATIYRGANNPANRVNPPTLEALYMTAIRAGTFGNYKQLSRCSYTKGAGQMPIVGKAWELHVERFGTQRFGAFRRTIGRYQVYRSGQAIPGLEGYMCEPLGPGDNRTPDNGKRVEAGRYPLWTHFGKYRSIGFSTDMRVQGDDPMPAIGLRATGRRVAILIHPAHPPQLYLSSTGCFNPSGILNVSQEIDYWDSRSRTIQLLDNLRDYCRKAFENETMARIGDAMIVVDGEPN